MIRSRVPPLSEQEDNEDKDQCEAQHSQAVGHIDEARSGRGAQVSGDRSGHCARRALPRSRAVTRGYGA